MTTVLKNSHWVNDLTNGRKNIMHTSIRMRTFFILTLTRQMIIKFT